MQFTTLITLTIAAVAGHAAAHSGDMTYHNFAGGLGACGTAINDGDFTVAVNEGYFTAANPNLDPVCGKTITVTYNGKTATAKVLDKCSGCNTESIDATKALFQHFTDLGAGRVHVDWTGI